jgi:hypothetical protein
MSVKVLDDCAVQSASRLVHTLVENVARGKQTNGDRGQLGQFPLLATITRSDYRIKVFILKELLLDPSVSVEVLQKIKSHTTSQVDAPGFINSVLDYVI